MADELVEAAQHGNVEKLKVFFKKGSGYGPIFVKLARFHKFKRGNYRNRLRQMHPFVFNI
jgi:hypothetical protein